jgi:signal transduction histidine kinase
MKTSSLAIRLFVSSAAWTLLVLPITAIALVSIHRSDVERSFDAQINQYISNLISVSFPDESADLREPDWPGDPKFTQPFSGWYWQIKPLASSNAHSMLRSASLVTETLKIPSEMNIEPDAERLRKGYVIGPDDKRLRAIELQIVRLTHDERRTYSYTVFGKTDDVDDRVTFFTWSLVVALTVLGGGLLVATFFQVRFGLMPLRDISARLAAIRSGDAAQLEGQLPDEIKPLQQELNALIQSNHDIVERSRTHVGNLAHALKTPLSVITNEARGHPDEFAAKIAEQAAIMREHITHHLMRAQAAARAGAVGGVTPIRPALNSVINALRRIYTERELEFEFACPDNAKFPGEKADFQEMAGNLLDNACKWAHSRVNVKVTLDGKQSTDEHRFFILLVDDDGPGLTPEQRAAVAQRGKRLDESKPGTGLGLSIVVDLAHLYKGACTLEEAPIGGLRARLVLPTV